MSNSGTPVVLPVRPPRRRRPRWLLPVAAAVLLVVLVVVVTGRQSAQEARDRAAGGAAVRTLVLALQEDGALVAALLLAVGQESTSGLLVPSRLLVGADGGSVPLAQFAAEDDVTPGQAVADALDVRVDGTWTLTAQGLADLVDAVGGVVVDVENEVRTENLSLATGQQQRLTGPQSAAYATHLAAEEAEPSRLARVDQVIGELLAVLPSDPDSSRDRLDDLGNASSTTLPPEALAELLAGAAASAASGSYDATVLPVVEIPTADNAVTYAVDEAAAAELIASRFGQIAAGMP